MMIKPQNIRGAFRYADFIVETTQQPPIKHEIIKLNTGENVELLEIESHVEGHIFHVRRIRTGERLKASAAETGIHLRVWDDWR